MRYVSCHAQNLLVTLGISALISVASSCSGGDDSGGGAAAAPAAAASEAAAAVEEATLAGTLETELETALTDAGLSAEAADYIAAQAAASGEAALTAARAKNIRATSGKKVSIRNGAGANFAIDLETDVPTVVPEFLEGAISVLDEASAGLSDTAERERILGVVLTAVNASLGTLVTSAAEAGITLDTAAMVSTLTDTLAQSVGSAFDSASMSSALGAGIQAFVGSLGSVVGADGVAAQVETLAQNVSSSLALMGIDSAELATYVSEVSEAFAAGLGSAGISAEEFELASQTMMDGLLAGLSEVVDPTTQGDVYAELLAPMMEGMTEAMETLAIPADRVTAIIETNSSYAVTAAVAAGVPEAYLDEVATAAAAGAVAGSAEILDTYTTLDVAAVMTATSDGSLAALQTLNIAGLDYEAVVGTIAAESMTAAAGSFPAEQLSDVAADISGSLTTVGATYGVTDTSVISSGVTTAATAAGLSSDAVTAIDTSVTASIAQVSPSPTPSPTPSASPSPSTFTVTVNITLPSATGSVPVTAFLDTDTNLGNGAAFQSQGTWGGGTTGQMTITNVTAGNYYLGVLVDKDSSGGKSDGDYLGYTGGVGNSAPGSATAFSAAVTQSVEPAEVASGSQVTVTLTLPAASTGKNYAIQVDTDTNAGNGPPVAEGQGTSNGTDTISATIAIATPGTYYVRAYVDVLGDGVFNSNAGDYMGWHSGTGTAPPGSASLTVDGTNPTSISFTLGTQ